MERRSVRCCVCSEGKLVRHHRHWRCTVCGIKHSRRQLVTFFANERSGYETAAQTLDSTANAEGTRLLGLFFNRDHFHMRRDS